MISYDLADRYIPEISLRPWDKTLKSFPDYSIVSDPPSLGLARRVKNWIEPRIQHLVNQELDQMYYTMRQAKRDCWEAAEAGTITEDQSQDLIYMMTEMCKSYRHYLPVATELILKAMLPNVEPKSAGFMVLWPDQKGRNKGREGRIMVRSGKGIRRMFPCLSDKEIEILNDAYRHEFSVRELTLKSGQSRANFAHAYHSPMGKLENPDTTSARKNLGNSCMRYNFTDTRQLRFQPTEAYGSGDFTIYWTEDAKGLICSRCVVLTAKETPRAAPIYGVCEKSLDMIQTALEANGTELYNSRHSNWEGGRLLRFDHCEGEYIAPYLDVMPQSLSEDAHDDKYLIIDNGGDINASSYQGILYGSNCRCNSCDDNLNQNDAMGLDGETYCQDCYYERVTSCEYCGDDTDNDDIRSVNTMNGEENWCEHCNRNHTELTDSGEVWHDEYVMTTAHGVTISQEEYDDEHFTSDWDNQIYPHSEMADFHDGSIVGLSEVSDNPDYFYCNDSETWKEKTDDNDNPTTLHTES